MHPYQLPKNAEQEAILRSKEALYGRTTYYTGPSPNYITTYPGSHMTPSRVHSIHNEVLVVGWMFNKACLDEQIIQRDAHLQAVDSSRRVASVGKPLAIKPADGSELAQRIADYQQAFVDDIDHFDESMRRLLYANAAGYAIEEAVFENKEIKFPLGKNTFATIAGPHPKQLDWVSNKCTRFDIGTDELIMDMGANQFASLPEQKFLIHNAPGDFQVRRRGYMNQAVWLTMIKNAAIARWGVILDIWGIPVPYGVAAEELWQDEKRKAEMMDMVRDYGLGKPAVFTSDFEVKASPSRRLLLLL
jgi:phage gp29-like protein